MSPGFQLGLDIDPYCIISPKKTNTRDVRLPCLFRATSVPAANSYIGASDIRRPLIDGFVEDFAVFLLDV